MKKQHIRLKRILCLLLALAVPAGQVSALDVPVRVSIKFICNASGDRPPTGNINTTAEVNEQIDRGNAIYLENELEFRIHLLEIRDVLGEEQYYDATLDERDAVRNAAIADPTTYYWRTDAVNMYITAGTSSARSDFPPNNNMVIVNQGINDTTLCHELGHSLNLYHTHQSGGDYCSDTLYDDADWTSRDQIAQYTYGLNYSQLTAAQQALVDNTWGNLMSYHDTDNRHVITLQQNDRVSDQSYSDRNWLLTDIPVYIKSGASSSGANGSWDNPYPTIQQAIDAGQVNNRTLILMNGTHADPGSVIDSNTDLISRRGTSYIQDVEPEYQLQYDVENSTNAAVREAVARAQRLRRQGDAAGSLNAMREAADCAVGRERHAPLIEIAERLMAVEAYDEAEAYFSKAAEESDQPGLKKRCGRRAEKMKKLKVQKLERIQQQQEEHGDAEEDQP